MKKFILFCFILWGFGQVTKANDVDVYLLPQEIQESLEMILDYPIIPQGKVVTCHL